MKILLITVLALSVTAAACRGQQRAEEVDPTLTAVVDSLLPRLEQLSACAG